MSGFTGAFRWWLFTLEIVAMSTQERAKKVDLGQGLGLFTPISFDDDENSLDKSFDLHADGRYSSKGHLSCQVCHSPDCEDGHFSVCHGAVKCFSSQVREVDGSIMKQRGCTRNLQMTSFICSVAKYDGRHVHKINQESAQYATNCCKTDFCNNQTNWPVLPEVPIIEETNDLTTSGDMTNDSGSHMKIIVAIVCPVFILILSVLAVLCFLKKRHRKRMEEINRMNVLGDASEFAGLRAHAVGDSTLREYQEGMTSGSGSGMPHLVERTLAKQIQLEGKIGQGRYGQVWRGVWNGDWVAVKVFNSHDEGSFKRETSVYSTTLLRHGNILGYYGSDLASYNSSTHMWLVTHYHPNGSLFDHLNKMENVITPKAAHKLIISALNGIVHLHTEIHGTQGKEGIAHRDIKSKNILVKSDLSCVIADFGLAVTHRIATNELNIPENNFRVGTRRYMSPEVLDFSINEETTFESFRRADIYSFALVMWEVLHRTEVPQYNQEEPPSYNLPYHKHVGPDPSFDDMREIVCNLKIRPELFKNWEYNEITRGLSLHMQECWRENPSARLTSLRLKKSISKLVTHEIHPITLHQSAFTNSISFS